MIIIIFYFVETLFGAIVFYFVDTLFGTSSHIKIICFPKDTMYSEVQAV